MLLKAIYPQDPLQTHYTQKVFYNRSTAWHFVQYSESISNPFPPIQHKYLTLLIQGSQSITIKNIDFSQS